MSHDDNTERKVTETKGVEGKEREMQRVAGERGMRMRID